MSKLSVWAVCGILLTATVWLQYQVRFNDNDGNQKIEALQTKIAALQTQAGELRRENGALKQSLHDVRGSPEYIEEQARKILFMIKPGEMFVMPADPVNSGQ